MDSANFQKLTLEAKLNVLFDTMSEIASKVNDFAKPKPLITKQFYKVSDIAKFCGKSYVTVERAAKTVGVDAQIINGVKAFTPSDADRIIKCINKCS